MCMRQSCTQIAQQRCGIVSSDLPFKKNTAAGLLEETKGTSRQAGASVLAEDSVQDESVISKPGNARDPKPKRDSPESSRPTDRIAEFTEAVSAVAQSVLGFLPDAKQVLVLMHSDPFSHCIS